MKDNGGNHGVMKDYARPVKIMMNAWVKPMGMNLVMALGVGKTVDTPDAKPHPVNNVGK